jgi:hypothetical protein
VPFILGFCTSIISNTLCLYFDKAWLHFPHHISLSCALFQEKKKPNDLDGKKEKNEKQNKKKIIKINILASEHKETTNFHLFTFC